LWTRHFFEESLGSLARLQEAKLEYLLAIINLFSHFYLIRISDEQCAVDDFTAFYLIGENWLEHGHCKARY
jgi:hypothetical protein